MRFHFHPDADAEFDRAVEYYEQCQPGLGLEFAEEVYATIARITEYPDAGPVMSKNTRRCLTNRFPFGLIYQIKTNALCIIAVANLHQRPGYWKERIEQNNRIESDEK
jgi:plasmid stabilization system protein ParE